MKITIDRANLTLQVLPMTTSLTFTDELLYPESDGQPMSESTEQYRWIVMVKENNEPSG